MFIRAWFVFASPWRLNWDWRAWNHFQWWSKSPVHFVVTLLWCLLVKKSKHLTCVQLTSISMAHVVYHNADISLLNDCLLVVGTRVGWELFKQCIGNTLLQRKQKHNKMEQKWTVILVTNALQYLSHPMLDHIVVWKSGLVISSGSYEDPLDHKQSHSRSFYMPSMKPCREIMETMISCQRKQLNRMNQGQLKTSPSQSMVESLSAGFEVLRNPGLWQLENERYFAYFWSRW